MRELYHLARLYKVQTSYHDIFGRLRQANPEALLRVLKVLGASVEHLGDVPGALRERQQSLWRRSVEPILVVWDEGPPRFKLRIPTGLAERPFRYQIEQESGESSTGTYQPRALGKTKEIEGVDYGVCQVALPNRLPDGYHRLRVEIGDRTLESLIITAPSNAYRPQEFKGWGIFLPLYALHSQRSWGAGDLADLGQLLEWVDSLRGAVVGTLPLLAAFLDEPFDPSPYSPVSRLFWNEFYLDITCVPELGYCAPAQRLLASGAFQNELENLRSAPLVDYRRQMALKRKVLEEMVRCLFGTDSSRRAALQNFVDSHPEVEVYARFRATIESERKPWFEWPERSRNGVLKPEDYSEEAKRYHLYAQWLAHDQIQALGEKSKRNGAALYLDLPLGVHFYGYDVWRERAAFALGMSAGAPPDSFFTKGQNWGFPPLHPERLRTEGYRYFIAYLRHHLRHAGLLRIDHVMAFHRLFWIPQDLEAAEGVYVHYNPEEFYAILTLESHRHRALIVGENLGTVPPYVNTMIAKHNILGMYVGQFSVRPDPPLAEVPPLTVASLNTHDTPTFAAFWEGADIEDRLLLGLLDEGGASAERQTRAVQKEALIALLRRRGHLGEATDTEAVLKAWLLELAQGPADLVLINLEDLWSESRPQNVPGTWNERPNWRRKARYRFEEFSTMAKILPTLKAVRDARC